MDIFDVKQDLRMFDNALESNAAYFLICALWISELAIWLYTCSGKRGSNRDATIWLIIGAWCFGVTAGKIFRDDDMPYFVRTLLFPHFLFYVGVALLITGIIIRLTAVVTLKHAFTLNVQTTDEQHLIKSGLYKIVRNPAYTGSILSLAGVNLMYRSVASFIAVIIACMICYSIRIFVEENVLREQFGDEFKDYCDEVKYRLFPKIY